ncbi:hypothetical protein DCAR_0101876 [Daucus carota subsp. sativus]|uniref:Uncharacterized protein n=1 Tax=Daucus carota subsp. sativus TaxID=79200 RepID=A0A166GQ38_DAUCS|nr:PREDICTED: uncharacterized protein LOC108204628 [Daucus carota subsp. sativus]WOG82709.1 hypothetical protein DCAR_0101876 [Daucus carota subsp. sativus]
MDPCPFVRIVVKNLAVKYLSSSNKSDTSFYCKMKIKNLPTQISNIPIQQAQQLLDQVHASFCLNKSQFEKLNEKSNHPSFLKIKVYKRELGCGLLSESLCGYVLVDLRGVENKVSVIKDGWVEVDKNVKVCLNVRVEPDPRFVFEFDGKPECSPQVFQVNGNVRQAVFTCKFGFKNSGATNRSLRSRSSLTESGKSRSWLSGSKKEQGPKERKGWSITIHDLSGSPVATASMVTPFVPSTGTNRVSRSNPGAWLILQPGQSTWKPWGRLEAWLETGDQLGYRFEHFPDGIDAITLTNSTLSTKKTGKFTIDNSSPGPSPLSTPSSSFDSGTGSFSDGGSGSWAHLLYRGFVMSSTVTSGGKCSKPEVEVSVNHVTCTEDAAAFVALAAAMNLSMDACSSFSTKLRKELRQSFQD